MIFKGKKFPELRADALFSAMHHMQYDAVNVGEGEFSLGKEFFDTVSKQGHFPFVSVNIAGFSAVKPYVIKEVGNTKVAITGITAAVYFPDDKKSKAFIPDIKAHVDALKDILPQLRQEADIVILLSHLGYQGTINLLKYNKINGVDVAIAGHGRKILREPLIVNDTIIVQNSMGGEYLGILKLEVGEDGLLLDYSGELIALTDDMPEESVCLQIMEDFSKTTYALEKAQKKERKQKELEERERKKNEVKAEILKMSPQDFVEMMEKENAGSLGGSEPAKLPELQ